MAERWSKEEWDERVEDPNDPCQEWCDMPLGHLCRGCPKLKARRELATSPTLLRLIEEVRNGQEGGASAYNRMHNRHNRS